MQNMNFLFRIALGLDYVSQQYSLSWHLGFTINVNILELAEFFFFVILAILKMAPHSVRYKKMIYNMN